MALEAAAFFERLGAKTHFITYHFHPDALFNGKYHPDIRQTGKPLVYPYSGVKALIYFPYQVLALRKRLRELKPDVIVARTSTCCIYLFFATIFTPFNYVTCIYETPIWALGDHRQYALIYRKAFRKLRESSPTYRYFANRIVPKPNLLKRLFVEAGALMEYLAVKKAKKVFAYSNSMKSEINEVYRKDAIVLRGGISEDMLTYKPKQDVKSALGISDKRMILSVCRLADKKRVDLLIKAFSKLGAPFADTVLVIGGRGPDEVRLKKLAEELNLMNRIIFAGFIPEDVLPDYYASCDVFAHPDWAEADITPIMALAFNKKVVWTTDMETPPSLAKSGLIFIAPPAPEDFAHALETALSAPIVNRADLSEFTWRRNGEIMLEALRPFLGQSSAFKA